MSNQKDAYYFSHDSNARNDEKLLAIRMKHKSSGYGVYWMIIERLRDSKDYLHVKDYNLIAFDLREPAEIIKSVIEDFGLFVFTDDGKHFYSESLISRMSPRDEARKTASISGVKGNLIKHGKATKAQLEKMTEAQIIRLNETFKEPDRHPTATRSLRKEKKGEEKKVKESDSALEFLEVNHKQRFEQEFLMTLKNQIKDFKRFCENFNDTAGQEKLEYDVTVLLPRLKKYARNWINNQRNDRQSQKPKQSFSTNR